jgi:threonine dehydratase
MHKDFIYFSIPKAHDIIQAHERILPFIHRTPILKSETLNQILGCDISFKCENLQKVGAFKSRGAVNAVFSLPDHLVRNGVCTHSSGNHAQALARAAKLRGVPAFIVMPDNAPKVKIDAVKGYGGFISFCEPTLKARETSLKEVIKETGSIEIHPYDNLKVVEGQATAAFEIFEEMKGLDIIITPVGGGGLLSGTALAAHWFSPNTLVMGAEPLGADDASRSFKSRTFIPSESPITIADGLLTSLGKYTFPIILKYVNDIIVVDEHQIIEAMKLIFQRLKVIVEPSSAVPLAAVMFNKNQFANKRIAIILSGGNVDFQTLNKLI